jgi:hypothetical protein
MTIPAMASRPDVPAIRSARVTQQDVRRLVRHYGLSGRMWAQASWEHIARYMMRHWSTCGAYGPQEDRYGPVDWAADEWDRARAAEGLLYTVHSGRDAFGLPGYLRKLDRDGVVRFIEELARALAQTDNSAVGYVAEAANSYPDIVALGLALGYSYPDRIVMRQQRYWTGIVPLTRWPAGQVVRD